jgi:hypothetical protein
MKNLFITLFLLAAPALASAQTATVLNPTTLSFDVSLDHHEMVGEIAVVTNYVMDIYQGSTLVLTSDLGKPMHVAGVVTVALSQGSLAKNTVYTLYVTAVGPGGSTRSVVSAPFAWLAAPRGVGNVRVQ